MKVTANNLKQITMQTPKEYAEFYTEVLTELNKMCS